MELLLILLVVAVWSLACVYLGIVVGIKDCKRRFNIPFGEQPTT